MIVKDDVPIAALVKRIFRETYGVDDDELYHNAELRERIRHAVKSLRASYQNNVCVTDYVAKICLKPNIGKSDGNRVFRDS